MKDCKSHNGDYENTSDEIEGSSQMSHSDYGPELKSSSTTYQKLHSDMTFTLFFSLYNQIFH